MASAASARSGGKRKPELKDTDVSVGASSAKAQKIVVDDDDDDDKNLLTCDVCKLPLSNPFMGTCGHQMCGHCTYELMEKAGTVHTALTSDNNRFGRIKSGEIACPFCGNERRTYHFAQALCNNLESMNPRYCRSLVDSTLRCPYVAYERCKQEFPGFVCTVNPTGVASNLVLYKILALCLEKVKVWPLRDSDNGFTVNLRDLLRKELHVDHMFVLRSNSHIVWAAKLVNALNVTLTFPNDCIVVSLDSSEL